MALTKRAMDIGLGGLTALVTLPLVLLLAVAVAAELRAWPLFVQPRVGRRGTTFRLVKLRTLPPSTPTDADKYALADVAIPPISARLRRLHLDELPQLWLVVTGRMSLVGPRPEMPGLHQEFEASTQRERTSVRPGCTGLWQISEAATGLIHEAPEYDLAYVRSYSLRLDLWILWHTLRMLVGQRPQVTLEAAPVRPAMSGARRRAGDIVAVEDSAAI